MRKHSYRAWLVGAFSLCLIFAATGTNRGVCADAWAASCSRPGNASPAATQQAQAAAPAGDLGEITVTARQRPETPVSVPISMQVFSAAKIQAAGLFDLNTLQYQAGFTFQWAASTAAAAASFPRLFSTACNPPMAVAKTIPPLGQASIDTIDVSRGEVLYQRRVIITHAPSRAIRLT